MINRLIKKILAEKNRFIKFGLVGCSGIVVNLTIVWLGNNVFFATAGEVFKTTVAYALAIAASIFTNYTLNFLWTWSDRRGSGGRAFLLHMLKYYVASLAAAGLQFAIANGITLLLKATLFSSQAAVPTLFKLGASLIGIIVGMLVNFMLNNGWTFKTTNQSTTKE